MKKKKENNQGFTLLEMLVVITILSIVVVILAGVLVGFLRVKFKNDTRIKVKAEGGLIMERIEYYIRNAQKLVTSDDNYGGVSGVDCHNITTKLFLLSEYPDFNLGPEEKKPLIQEIDYDSNQIKVKTYKHPLDGSSSENILSSPEITVKSFSLDCDKSEPTDVEPYQIITVDFELEKEGKTIGTEENKVTSKFVRTILMRN